MPISETGFWKSLPETTRWEVARRSTAFLLSNFLHGEQGALMVAGQLVGAVPHTDVKFYAATQTLDEARHTGYGIKYLNRVVPTLADEEKSVVEDFAFESARLLIDSRAGTSVRENVLDIWRGVGIDPADALAKLAQEREALGRALQRSGGRMGPVSGFVIPTLQAIGLFSERIADHFAEMFEANFHSPEARNLARLAEDLPEDLEAWGEES
jgi:hypothetical protein